MSGKISLNGLIAVLMLAISVTITCAAPPEVEWTRQLGSSEGDYAEGVFADSTGNAYITGLTRGSLDGNPNAGELDIFLAKYDTNGNKLWTRQLGTSESDSGLGVSVDGSGNVYVAGTTTGGFGGNANKGGYDVFLVKISSVPEPNSIALLLCGLLSAACLRRRK